MELARELSKDQSIPRKTEPLVPSSDSWQQDWNRDERTSTKVYFSYIQEFYNSYAILLKERVVL